MCLDDWRAGRLIRSVGRNATAITPGSTPIAANQQRVGLRVSNGGVVTGTDPWHVETAAGVMVFSSQLVPATFFITLADNGDLPTQAFNVFADGANNITFGITEYIAPETMLTAALEQFRREYGLWR